MLTIYRLSVGQLQSNCYLAVDQKSNDCMIVDPGDDAEYIIKKITEIGAKPRLIVATHAHFDHVMAVFELMLTYKIPFYMHHRDEFLLKNARSSSLYFTGVDPLIDPPKIDMYFKNGSVIKQGENTFRIVWTPGHTPGSCTLYCQKEKLAFVGDLLFADSTKGRYDFSYSDEKLLDKSIRIIMKFPGDTTLYSGHGNKFLLKAVKKYFKTNFRIPRVSVLGDDPLRRSCSEAR